MRTGQLAAQPRLLEEPDVLCILERDGSVRRYVHEETDEGWHALDVLRASFRALEARFSEWSERTLWHYRSPSAIARRDDGTFRLLREGLLDGVFEVGWPACCAAFDETAQRLALIDPDEVVILAPEHRRVPLPACASYADGVNKPSLAARRNRAYTGSAGPEFDLAPLCGEPVTTG